MVRPDWPPERQAGDDRFENLGEPQVPAVAACEQRLISVASDDVGYLRRRPRPSCAQKNKTVIDLVDSRDVFEIVLDLPGRRCQRLSPRPLRRIDDEQRSFQAASEPRAPRTEVDLSRVRSI